jgi:hypothetical protein
MRNALAAIILAIATPAHAEVKLRYGGEIPPGWANGLTYSLRSLTECRQEMAHIPNDSPSKRMMRCLVRIDPNAKLPPMS